MTDRDLKKDEKAKAPAPSREDDEPIAIELPLEENDQNAQPS